MPLEPQAAIESAVTTLLTTAVIGGGLGWDTKFCKRMLDGQPPPLCGPWFASVWHDGSRQAGPTGNVNLDEIHAFSVTVTVRLVQPFDRWVQHRDELETKVNDLRALIFTDRLNHVIINAANTLAGFRAANVPDGTNWVGFCEALKWESCEPIQEVGPEWFHANVDQGDRNCGLAQRVRFKGPRRVQTLANMQ